MTTVIYKSIINLKEIDKILITKYVWSVKCTADLICIKREREKENTSVMHHYTYSLQDEPCISC